MFRVELGYLTMYILTPKTNSGLVVHYRISKNGGPAINVFVVSFHHSLRHRLRFRDGFLNSDRDGQLNKKSF